MLATPPFGASSNKALLRANIKPPVELVVADLVHFPVVMYRLRSHPVVSQAEICFKSVPFAVFSVGCSEENMVVFHVFVAVVSIQRHAEVTLLYALVL